MRYTCVFLAGIVGLTSIASAARVGSVHGELVCGDCKSFLDLSVEIQDLNNRFNTERAMVASDGSFELRSLEEGTYLVNIVNSTGEVVKRDTVLIRGVNASISLQLDPKVIQKPVAGLVSVSQLRHKVPSRAEREYARSQSRFDKGDLAGSAECLEKAIAIDPDYMEAHNNLGSRYMGFGQMEKALTAFKRAAELDPQAQLVQVNMAVALLQLGRYAEAEKAARQGVHLASTDAKAHYVLGLSLFAQHQYSVETAESLNRAFRNFPAARLPLAHVLARRGDRDNAKLMLEAYLSGPGVEKRAEAERLLLALR